MPSKSASASRSRGSARARIGVSPPRGKEPGPALRRRRRRSPSSLRRTSRWAARGGSDRSMRFRAAPFSADAEPKATIIGNGALDGRSVALQLTDAAGSRTRIGAVAIWGRLKAWQHATRRRVCSAGTSLASSARSLERRQSRAGQRSGGIPASRSAEPEGRDWIGHGWGREYCMKCLVPTPERDERVLESSRWQSTISRGERLS